ncbi:MAG: hypothetical protein ACPGVF_00650 [Flavobacteriaceae bacterium]
MKTISVLAGHLLPLSGVMFIAFLLHCNFGTQNVMELIVLYGVNTLLAAVPILGLYRALFVVKKGVFGFYLSSVALKGIVLWFLFVSKWSKIFGFEEFQKSTLMIPFFLALLLEIFAFVRFNSK